MFVSFYHKKISRRLFLYVIKTIHPSSSSIVIIYPSSSSILCVLYRIDMSFKPFMVGLIASSAMSYNILSQLADRRLFGMPKLSENDILTVDYQNKHDLMIREAYSQSFRGSPRVEGVRSGMNKYVVDPIYQSANAVAKFIRDLF